MDRNQSLNRLPLLQLQSSALIESNLGVPAPLTAKSFFQQMGGDGGIADSRPHDEAGQREASHQGALADAR